MRRIVILGSTGSIGKSSLEVIAAHPDRLRVVGLTAHTSWDRLLRQAARHRPSWVTLTDNEALDRVDPGKVPAGTELLRQADRVERMVRSPETDVVLTAVVGAAGLAGTWASVEAGKTLCIANKETLVLAGAQIMGLARRTGATVLPVDSEHSALFQCLRCGQPGEVRRMILTASGGPFRTWSLQQIADATPRMALRHPTWQMGPKITIDSATMMNKALEIIEAKWLFGLRPEQIEVIVHPQSIVHSMVEFADGSVVAQLSRPDMKLPIQYALCYPERLQCPVPKLDLGQMASLDFFAADRERFPALELGYEVAGRGGTSGAVLNAANEVAVERFLSGGIKFLDIVTLCRDVLYSHHWDPDPDLDALQQADSWARQQAAVWS